MSCSAVTSSGTLMRDQGSRQIQQSLDALDLAEFASGSWAGERVDCLGIEAKPPPREVVAESPECFIEHRLIPRGLRDDDVQLGVLQFSDTAGQPAASHRACTQALHASSALILDLICVKADFHTRW